MILDESHKRAFVHLISAAFEKDPLFVHLLGPEAPAGRREKLAGFLWDKAHLMAEQRLGVAQDGKLLAACLLATPESRVTPSFPMIWRSLRLLRHFSPALLQQLNAYAEQTQKHAPDVAHHYLVLIGTHPEHQGQGLGKQLMTHIMQKVKQHRTSAGLALDTENADNVRLYQHLGFDLRHEAHLKDLPLYCMFRPREETT
ncbi:hypothetical protein DC3_20600 [Deinococcus cellulosilyticus NBRC 106333 = KACC 11606]|uniref:N-acetyltransferase domain-containing protein n=2 Tax=Deinococcus cellulosilyticus TaxID=401558 RepID=A0A511N0M1_DEIC1|nr:hypothetical protein DC3_20600 [Deinococcus cellulosilyticus NBRC 106333 = KACC 11606]